MKNLFGSYSEEEYAILDKLYPYQMDLDKKLVEEVQSKIDSEWELKYSLLVEDMFMWPYIKYQNSDIDPVYYLINTDTFEEYTTKFDDKLIGKAPEKDDEIVISSYVADSFLRYGLKVKDNLNKNTKEKQYYPKSYEQIIQDGKYLNLGGLKYVKVVGIVDFTAEFEKYEVLKEYLIDDIYTNAEEDSELLSAYVNFMEDNKKGLYVNKTFIEAMMKNEHNEQYVADSSKFSYSDTQEVISCIGYFKNDSKVVTNKGKQTFKSNTLKENEIVINSNMLNAITKSDYNKKLSDYLMYYYVENTDSFLASYLSKNGIIGKKVKINISDGQYVAGADNYKEYTIVGVINDEDMSGENKVYFEKSAVDDLIMDRVSYQSLTTKVKSVEELKQIENIYPSNNGKVLSRTALLEVYDSTIIVTSGIKTVAKYFAIVLGVITFIILTRLSINAIKYRKKEIGILRALGAKSKDVCKMFIYEGLLLVTICMLIGGIITNEVTIFINEFLNSEVIGFWIGKDLSLKIFDFGIIQIASIAIILIVIVMLANILPIRKITKKKPIDAILNR